MASYSINDLNSEAKERYLQKLTLCNIDTCPYLFPADAWKNDPTKWPSVEWPEVYEYLISTPGVFTREAMKNRKSLEAHNQFTSGWVRTVFHLKIAESNCVLMKADVMPSQSLNDNPHVAWVAVNADGSIRAAHCSCMAG